MAGVSVQASRLQICANWTIEPEREGKTGTPPSKIHSCPQQLKDILKVVSWNKPNLDHVVRYLISASISPNAQGEIIKH